MENLKMLETFRKLEETLGKEATRELISLFDQKLNEMEKNLATKADIADLRTEIADSRTDVHKAVSTTIKWAVGSGILVTVGNILLNHFM